MWLWKYRLVYFTSMHFKNHQKVVKNHKILHKMSTALSQKFLKGTYHDLCHLNPFNMKFHWHKWFFHSVLSFLSYVISKVSVYSSKNTLKQSKNRVTKYYKNGMYDMSTAICRKLIRVRQICLYVLMISNILIHWHKYCQLTRNNFRDIAIDISYTTFWQYFVILFLSDLTYFLKWRH